MHKILYLVKSQVPGLDAELIDVMDDQPHFSEAGYKVMCH